MHIATIVVAVAFVTATLLPLLPSANRWIRIFDFPRVQISVGLIIVGLMTLLQLRTGSALDAFVLVSVAGCLAFQTVQIIRYTPVFPKQAGAAIAGEVNTRVKIVIANVLMDNRGADALIAIVREADPDIALFVETDQWWDSALGVLEESHAYTLRQPQDNYYGMALFSRLPLVEPEIRFLIRDEIPSIKTGVEIPSGDVFTLYGLHPVPPPLADTEMRDGEILMVAREIAKADGPAIVAGDLNDVSWSRTTRMFMRISRLLDPRIGRGFFASYNAKNPLIRWPLDHVFHDADFKVEKISLLKSFGSDHFPISLDLCFQPHVPSKGTPPKANGADRREAAEKIEAGKNAEPGENDYPNSA